MRDVIYRLIDVETKAVDSEHNGSLLEFAYNMVGVTQCAVIPPFDILNERLRSGGECNPFGNTSWEPFEVTREEYEELCAAASDTDPASIFSYKGIRFVKLKRAKEFDDITDQYDWSQKVSAALADEYIDALVSLNPSDEQFPDSGSLPSSLGSGEIDTSEPPVPPPDLDAMGTQLTTLCERAIRQFADAHKAERFYAFGFDLDVNNGHVGLCANTESGFQRTAESYKREWDYTETQLQQLRFNFGDWHYQGFNLDHEEWDAEWVPTSDQICEYLHSSATPETEAAAFCEAFIEIAIEVLLALEHEGVLDALQKEDEFRLLVMDHDENEEQAAKRFDRVKAIWVER